MRTKRVTYWLGCLAAIGAIMGVLCVMAEEAGTEPDVGRTVAYLGVGTSPVDETLARQLKLPEGVGLVVDYVDPEGPSARALQSHDVLSRLDDQILVSHEQLAVLVHAAKPGQEVRVTLVREGLESTATVKLGEKPYTSLQRMHEGPFGFLPPSMDIFSSDRNWRFDANSIREMHEKIRRQLEETGKGSNFVDDIMKMLKQPSGEQGSVRSVDTNVSARIHDSAYNITMRAATGDSGTYTVVENGYTATLTVNGTDNQFRVTDPDGKVVHAGPVNTEDEIGKLPDQARKLYDKIAGTRKMFSKETQI